MASISGDILARYAGDAAREVAGVRRLARRRATKVTERGGHVTVELHLGVEWGASIPSVGRAVQDRVRGYLIRMADLESVVVNVVVDEVE
ncbi:MAG: Asp23/Gls24 family envelope stress response protein [Gaiellaceae bacterium]